MTTKPAHENPRDNAAHGGWQVTIARGESQVTSPRGNSLKTSVRIASLRCLTDKDLLRRLLKTRGTERAAQAAVVKYLVEVDRRRLYLPRGYGSLFEFCTDYLKYSRSSAARRIGAARCIGRFPRVAELFERGELDLTVISLVAGVLTDENCGEIVSWLRGRSLREVEALAARRQPGRAVKDQVRKIYIMSVKQDEKADGGTSSPCESLASAGAARNGTEPHAAASPAGRSEEPTGAARSGTEPGTALSPAGQSDVPASAAVHAVAGRVAAMHHCPVSTPSAGTKTVQSINNKSLKNRGVHAGSGGAMHSSVDVAPGEHITVEPKFKLQFTVDPEFMQKLERVKSLLSTRYPKGVTFETIFDILMSEYLERHSPEERIKRRDARREHNKNKHIVNKDNPCTEDERSRRGADTPRTIMSRTPRIPRVVRDGSTTERNRHIPQAVRDEVFRRDGGRCAFVGDDGKRCNSGWNLQVDHIVPYAKGGDNSPENLRLLCAKHNHFEAERAFGRDHMEKFHRRE